jgi:hypothetical protein
VAAALFQWGLLLASLTGLIVVGWAVVLTDLQD